jgi:enterochelin esterase-like enzyme
MSISFHTIKTSDPRFETENLREVTVKSAALGMRADLTVHVPDATRGRAAVPLILLLHGVYGSHWAWTRTAGAHRIAADLQQRGVLPPCVLAMPSDGLWGDGSGYLPHRNQNFERWIVEEVPAAVRAAAPCVSEASPCCITGLSMGGFGALRLAAKYPERFVAAAGMSSITHFREMKLFVEEPLESYDVPAADHSVADAILRCRTRRPALWLDCGTEDALLEGNRSLHAALRDAGIAHTYREYPGGHTWDYWIARLPEVLTFFAEAMDAGAK